MYAQVQKTHNHYHPSPLQLGLIHDSKEEGIVLRAQCKKKGLPHPERVYAMKVLTNYFQAQTATQVRGGGVRG